MKLILALFALVLMTAPLAAKPAPLQPSPFGIDALKPRFGKDMPNIWKIEDELANYLVDAGIRWDRASIDWGDVQTEKGGPLMMLWS